MKRNNSFKVLLVAAAMVLGTSACSTAAAPPSTPTTPDVPNSPAITQGAAPAHWSYEGATGPANWGELESEFAACSQGKSQSPIDIPAAGEKSASKIEFHYQPSALRILNNGHTVQANYDEGSYLEIDGVKYQVAQFHYHTPSEHDIDGKEFPGELHIVHKNSDRQLAVVGLMLKSGSANAAFEPFIKNLPPTETEEKDAGVQIDLASMLPTDHEMFQYDGSLTTPPCSESVSWMVMTTPVELSQAQLGALEGLFGNNDRPVQPLNGRLVEVG